MRLIQKNKRYNSKIFIFTGDNSRNGRKEKIKS
jgi:hypothetical protein